MHRLMDDQYSCPATVIHRLSSLGWCGGPAIAGMIQKIRKNNTFYYYFDFYFIYFFRIAPRLDPTLTITELLTLLAGDLDPGDRPTGYLRSHANLHTLVHGTGDLRICCLSDFQMAIVTAMV